MSDLLLMENMLLLLKSCTEVYVHGILESSNKKVHDVLKFGLDENIKLQNDLYQKMTECGWYKIQNVNSKHSLKKLKQK